MGENVYKWDRFLGKFKKGPPHIGEYEKKCILEEANRLWLVENHTQAYIRT